MSAGEKANPPKWIQSLLRRFASEETLEEVEGDLLEFYGQWVSSMGRTRANWKYFFAAMTLLRPLNQKKNDTLVNTTFIMIRSYFIMSWRTILKNKVSTFINLSGLTLGLTTSLLILLVVLKEFDYDRFHVRKDSIYLLMKNEKTNEGILTGQSTAGPVAEALRTEFSEVARAARVAKFGDRKILVNATKSTVSGIFADPDIFRIMTFKEINGDAAAALDNHSIVITKSMAVRLFGDREALGQTVVFDGYNTLEVGAVIEDIPQASSLKFEMAIPFKIYEKSNAWLSKWDDNRIFTWMELYPNADLAAFNSKASLLIQKKTNEPYITLFAYPLTELHLRGRFSNGHPAGGNIMMVRVLIGFGVFMLLIACVNFMNIVTAQSSYRAREVGVRKVLGAARRWIALQFLNEALVVTFMALLGAILLTVIVIPSFNVLTHASISFEFDNPLIWILSFFVTLVTALVAGSYPALVLSRFAPARVLKGIVDHPKGSSLRRALVTFQFVISITVLVGTIILFAQFDHVKSRPMGYQQENLVKVRLDSLATAKFNYVKNEVSKIRGVQAATGMKGNVLYSDGSVTGMDWPGKKPEDNLSIVVADVEYDWIQTIGLEIVKGRDFNSQFKSDLNGCLLNQSAVDRMGLDNPIGSLVGGHPVVGVFNDFVYNNPFGVIAPMAVFLAPEQSHHLYVRVENDNSWNKTIQEIEKVVRQASPDIEFSFEFTVEEYNANFSELSDVGLMVSIFGGMTIFISCLGLFGLAGFIAERRGKEMSIRKVFGASNVRVLLALTGDILKPVAVAIIIVIPVSVWLARLALDQFVYRVTLNWWMFGQAVIMVLAVSIVIIVYHGWRTASESPSLRLKSE
ncbi:MAG TPA: ABC transporter permease [Cyclobacteriaceae bacterium]|nr:ABC transporter permease [Cyclobacteriaceae bacterium]